MGYLITENIDLIVEKLKVFLQSDEPSSFFNYEQNLLIDKAPYLDAFIEDRPFPPFEVEIQMSSKCNLQCKWCIGEEVQEKDYIMRLSNQINTDNIDVIVDGIIDFKVDGLGIEIVKFSGFIGEPLLKKKATLTAMQKLVGAGIKVGLFTNGVLMVEDTWETLSNINYVHISLDAGRSSFFWLKESGEYTEKTFDTIINNIKGLSKTRQEKELQINVGYIIVQGNHNHIFETAKLVKDVGVNSIRFKCDIGERYILSPEIIKIAFDDIDKVKSELADESFTVHAIHSKKEIERKNYNDWNRKMGCHYHNFLSTIGSDGSIYLCDHNTMPGAVPLGNAIKQSFKSIWEDERRKYLTDSIWHTCYSDVCPPFGNKLNFFLKEIYELKEKYGVDCMKEAIKRLRGE